MDIWLIPKKHLFFEQQYVIEKDIEENLIINGPPGSGKTQIILHRAKFLSDYYKIKPERFHIFVFTNVLKDYISSALTLLDIPEDCVTTIDAWCMSYFKKYIHARVPYAHKQPDFKAIREAVLRNFREKKLSPIYDFVVVDEGQDLPEESFKLLKAIATHITVCMDNKQQIYENGCSEKAILKILELRKRDITLLGAYRCSPFIAAIASTFIADKMERQVFATQNTVIGSEKETPLLYYAKDFEDERLRLLEITRTRVAKGEKIAILFPQNRMIYGYANGFRENNIEVETPKNLNFSSNLPKLLSFHGAKGLTFDTVLIPRLVKAYYKKLDTQEIDRLLFVGMTRARKWLYLSTCGENPIDQVLKAELMEELGSITVQSCIDADDNEDESEYQRAEDDDLLDLL